MADNNFVYCPLCTTKLIEKDLYDARRQVCPACGFINFLEPKLVAVVVVKHREAFLLGRRCIDPGNGQWSFVSGYVNRGEKVEEAALREVKEETNLDVQLEQLLGVYSERGNPHVVVAYQASTLESELSRMTAQASEVSELAFFTLQEMPELAFPIDQQIKLAIQKS
jgi:8-oxo-dGTP diphosphatase